MTTLYLFLSLIAGILIGIAIDFVFRKKQIEQLKEDNEKIAREKVLEVEKMAEDIKKKAVLEAREELYAEKVEMEKEIKERRKELQNLERRLVQKEENLEMKLNLLDRKDAELQKKKKALEQREASLEELEKKYNEMIQKEKAHLEKIAGLTAQEAKQILMEQMKEQARLEASAMIKKIYDEAVETAEIQAKNIIATAIQRCASDYVAENTVSVVDLPNDEMKGRIIGREGRNIRALENATGIDLIIDDTPEAVILSGFDPIRREIAANVLSKLIADGRIHPGRIEEVVAKTKKEIYKQIKETGKQAAFDLNIHNLHDEILSLVGKLKYRSSYGQNVLKHSIEVAQIASVLASELGVNAKVAKRAGLLHDIGKAIDHEMEGAHAKIGAELAKKFGEPDDVVHAISAHHNEEEPKTIEAVIIQAADALSAARPGARREIIETYVKRLEKLEAIAHSFPGVEKAYAIQAGREIRIIVEPQSVDDNAMAILVRDIAKKVESELEYPGEIKVTAIRETRSVSYAK